MWKGHETYCSGIVAKIYRWGTLAQGETNLLQSQQEEEVSDQTQEFHSIVVG